MNILIIITENVTKPALIMRVISLPKASSYRNCHIKFDTYEDLQRHQKKVFINPSILIIYSFVLIANMGMLLDLISDLKI
jgi:hypothetical protein